jgi:hypothetical protein
MVTTTFPILCCCLDRTAASNHIGERISDVEQGCILPNRSVSSGYRNHFPQSQRQSRSV